MEEIQELHCHACNRYVRFKMDMSLDGNHVLNCPNCGHEHCRVVKNGRITEDRWDSRNGGSIMVVAIGYYTTSMYTSSTSFSITLTDSWASSLYNTSTAC